MYGVPRSSLLCVRRCVECGLEGQRTCNTGIGMAAFGSAPYQFRSWNTPRGYRITPDGLLKLLQKCQSLYKVAIAVDTRGYTESPEKGLLESTGFTMPCVWINVVDSAIEAESVPVLEAFFAWTPFCAVDVHSLTCRSVRRPGWNAYKERWDEVYTRARAGRVGQHS